MRKIAFTITALLTLCILTGCAVSADERAACETTGGTVKTESFTYSTTAPSATKRPDASPTAKTTEPSPPSTTNKSPTKTPDS